MSYEKDVGAKIRELRIKKGLTLREVGNKLDMDYSYIGRIERGFLPSTKVIRSIADFFGVDVSIILGEEKEIPEEIQSKIKKWYSLIQKSEQRGYSPEDISKILDTIDAISGNKDQSGDK